jgi:hypothetical protein
MYQHGFYRAKVVQPLSQVAAVGIAIDLAIPGASVEDGGGNGVNGQGGDPVIGQQAGRLGEPCRAAILAAVEALLPVAGEDQREGEEVGQQTPGARFRFMVPERVGWLRFAFLS